MRSNKLCFFHICVQLLHCRPQIIPFFQVEDGPTRCVQLGMGSWHPSWTPHCFADGTGGSKPSFGLGVSSATPEQHCLDLRHPARGNAWRFDEGYQLRSQRSRGCVKPPLFWGGKEMYALCAKYAMKGNHPRREFSYNGGISWSWV